MTRSSDGRRVDRSSCGTGSYSATAPTDSRRAHGGGQDMTSQGPHPGHPDPWGPAAGAPNPAHPYAMGYPGQPVPPPAAVPPYGQPYAYGYPYALPRRTNGLAIASMVLGILWIYWIG